MVDKFSQAKIKHHYVWASYLRNWSLNERDVYYTTAKGNIACDSVKGLAMEKDFYKSKRLTKEHLEHVNTFASLFPEGRQDAHIDILNGCLYVQKIEDIGKSLGNKEIQEIINTNLSNYLEFLHSCHEDSALEIIKSLAKGDLTILSDDKRLSDFSLFLGHQVFRTKKMKAVANTIISNIDTTKSRNVSRSINECWWFLSYMFGINLGLDLFGTRHDDGHCLLINNTSVPFITSDHPVIDIPLTMREENRLSGARNVDFYYPISPKIAYMIKAGDRLGSSKVEVTDNEADEMNSNIAKRANVHIFGDSESAIKPYRKQLDFG